MQSITAPAIAPALGPYSHAIADAPYLFCSGQLPVGPDGTLAAADIASQAHCVFDNLAQVLAAGGSSLAHVLKATVFLTDLADFADMNQIYAQYFGSHRPARTTVQVAALPRGAALEIEVIAKLAAGPR